MSVIDLPGADIALFASVFPDSHRLFNDIEAETPWKQEHIKLFGRLRPMPRLTCWMGDSVYVYSGLENQPASWGSSVEVVRRQVEELTQSPFNGVLLNLYRDGSDSMGWHADDESSLGAEPVIASVSLGAVRRFRLKPKKHHRGEAMSLDLPDGSVLIMRGTTQRNWLHAIPKTARDVGPRINLTFRYVIDA